MPHAQRKHAKLSPSGAGRWLACPGCIDLIDSLGLAPAPAGIHADTGTAAHELLEVCLSKGTVPDKYLGKIINGIHVDKRMAEGVEVAVDHIRKQIGKAKLHTEEFVKIPVIGDGGTVDAWAQIGQSLYVWDYKNGVHPVEARNNPQLMLYALGCLEQCKGVEQVLLSIIQPNSLDGILCKTHEIPVRKLWAWRDEKVVPIVAAIGVHNGQLSPGDEQCRYCAAAARCPALARKAAAVARMDFKELLQPSKEPMNKQPKLTDADINAILSHLPMMERMIKAARQEAMRIVAAHPERLRDWKVVEGKSNRRWKDAERTMEVLARKFDEDEFAPRRLLGLGEISSLLPKHIRDKFMSKHTEKPRGQPTLAKATDPRPAISSDALADFEDEIEEE